MRRFVSAAFLSLAAVLGGSLSCSALAQTYFVYDGTCAVAGGSSNCTSSGVTATATAWGNTGSGGAFAQGQLQSFGNVGVGAYTGVNEGATGSSAAYDNQHAFDSITSGCTAGGRDSANGNSNTINGGCGGSQELMLLNFSAKVDMVNMSVGFCGTNPKECDMSILRWDGVGNPNLAANGLTGWSLVASQDLGGSGTAFTYNGVSAIASNVSLGTQVSSWWMISTYYGATTGALDAGNDRFKVLGLGVNVCTGGTGSNGGQYNGGTCTTVSVPTPGTLALTGAALLGLYVVRRYRPQQGRRSA